MHTDSQHVFFFSQTSSTESHSQVEMLSRLLSQVDKEMVEVARREANSVLRLRSYIAMRTLNFAEIIEEMKTLCPTVFVLLSQMILLDHNPGQRTAPLALLYGIMMFHRCKEMSRIQRVNTVLVTEGDASPEVHYIMKMFVFLSFNNKGKGT